MKLDVSIDLESLDWDGESMASAIADEVRTQIAKKVREAVKSDPSMEALVKKVKDMAVAKLMGSIDA